ncbi:MAG TPA: DUF2339 domain-containing protein [Reyranella sp.]|nr:DUF2339 domain-containing protein [Reyranella sp.]
MDWILLVLLAVAVALGTPIVAIIALARTSDLRRQNERLAAEVASLRERIAGLAPTPAAEILPAEPEVVSSLSEPLIERPIEEVGSVEPDEVVEPEPLPPPFEPAPVPVKKPGLEQQLGARAFIWIGAITLALAGIFLVRYSIEEGWLSPLVRVVLTTLFGFGLIAGGTGLRPKDDRVAQAMAAAGVAALYGALLSAVDFYHLISQAEASFLAVALTAFAIGMALRHGPLVAWIAFVGGFVSPAIIGSEHPSTATLFGYLLAIAAATLAVIRHRGWWNLGWGVLAGAALWTCAWLIDLPSDHVAAGPFELHWVGIFLVAVAGLFVWATWRRLGEGENAAKGVVALVWAALGVTGLLLFVLVADDAGQQEAGWLALALHGAGLYALGRWTPRFQRVAALAPVLSLLALVLWWNSTRAGVRLGGWDEERFAWRAALMGGLYAGGAFALMWNAARPGFWAGLSAGAALGHFLLAWFVLRDSAPAAPWGMISIALAAPYLVGAERAARWRGRMTGATEALGMLAAAVCFFIAIAIALELRREWITVAYALELAAIAVIATRLDLVAMRRLCWPLLAAVLVRFVLNPEILHYPLGLTPILNWILWSYGIAALALATGAHHLRGLGDARLVMAVKAGAALLVFALLTLEVRCLFQPGTMDTPDSDFMERASYVLVWGGFALAALWSARLSHDPVALWAWRVSGAFAAVLAIGAQVLFANPIVATADVGEWPILNGLLLAYAVPAGMAFVARRWAFVEGRRGIHSLCVAVGAILAFAWISFEVRHVFDPRFTRRGFDADGVELYAYSIVWLLFGVALLAVGFRRGIASLRHVGMVLVCLVVGKVFLIDMAGLHGLLRVVSFLGLGAALLGLGFVYRRLGFDARSE